MKKIPAMTKFYLELAYNEVVGGTLNLIQDGEKSHAYANIAELAEEVWATFVGSNPTQVRFIGKKKGLALITRRLERDDDVEMLVR